MAALQFSDLPIPLYLCALDDNATFSLFGPPDDGLQFQYHWARVGPPRDAPILDALIAALSMVLSTEPARVPAQEGEWFRDCRPVISDAGALVADLEAADPRPIVRRKPHSGLLPRGGDGRLVGRLAVLDNRSYNDFNRERTAFFFLFECEDHREAALALFEASFAWARSRGLDRITGSKGFTAFDGLGLLYQR